MGSELCTLMLKVTLELFRYAGHFTTPGLLLVFRSQINGTSMSLVGFTTYRYDIGAIYRQYSPHVVNIFPIGSNLIETNPFQ
jgi:hypothetical protein